MARQNYDDNEARFIRQRLQDQIMQERMANGGQSTTADLRGIDPAYDVPSYFNNGGVPSYFDQDGHEHFTIPPLTITDALLKSHERSVKNIFKYWTLLNHIIERAEALIQTRWLKKNRQQRKAILLTAWPDMPVPHRPDLHAFFQERSSNIPGSSSSWDDSSDVPYLWPNINQEDLLKPKILPIFLNARARHPPSSFAEADYDSFRFCLDTERLVLPHLPNATMMFTGRNTPETYGQQYFWKDHPEAEGWLLRRQGVLGGDGYKILFVQEKTYEFLVKCCQQILHDISPDVLATNWTPTEPEPPALTITEDGGMNSQAALALMTPYRLPARLDLGRLRDLFTARQSALEDHIWSLREDPGYFAEYMRDVWDHRQETILDTYGKPHSTTLPHATKQLWDRVFGSSIAEAYRSLVAWNDLRVLIDKALTLQEKYQGRIHENQSLPKDLLEAFLDLEFALRNHVVGPIRFLRGIFNPSPPVRANFVRVPEREEADSFSMTVGLKTDKDVTMNRLVMLIHTMSDDHQLILFGLGNILDEMDRLVERDAKVKNLFSPLVSSVLEDLSLLAECQRQVRLYQPWAATFASEIVLREQDMWGRYLQRTKLLKELNKNVNQVPWPALDPTSRQFSYPADKRRTKEVTEAMQKSEHTLDAFWKSVDKSLLHNVDVLRQGALYKLLDSRTLQRTPDWVEPQSLTPLSKTGKQQKAQAQDGPLSQLELDSKADSSSGRVASGGKASKNKTKTRGVASAMDSLSISESPSLQMQENDTRDQRTVTVDKRALKVFSTLFHQPSNNSLPGEIPWTDFLHAMGSVGFAIEKLYGSVWHFAPSTSHSSPAFEKNVSERSIQFHEPHPVAKIPFQTARRIGRRLPIQWYDLELKAKFDDFVEKLEESNGPATHGAAEARFLWDNLELPATAFKKPPLKEPIVILTPLEAKKEAKERVSKIFKNWTLLNSILDRHETLIQRRWLKKNRQQRKTILLSAWPDMPASHRPDLEFYLREIFSSSYTTPKTPLAFSTMSSKAEFNKDPFLWPHINQEDLLKPKMLLIFLNARARHFPSAFAEADRDSLKFALACGKVQPAHLSGHTMMFKDRNSESTYGQILAWFAEGGLQKLMTGRAEQPGKGLLILEVQERIYSFLVECCLQILHDMPRKSLETAASPIEPEPPKLSIVEGGVNSLAAISAMAPYRLPASLDLGRLQDLVSAKRSDFEDHIWSLREDPSYFAESMQEELDHLAENLKNFNGQTHPSIKPQPAKKLWGQVGATVMAEALYGLEMWTDLHKKIGKVMTLQRKFAAKITFADDLPTELLTAFLDLDASLHQYIKIPILTLRRIAFSSPPMRSSFISLEGFRQDVTTPKSNDPRGNMIDVAPTETCFQDSTRVILFWYFEALWDDNKRFQCGVSTLLDGVERLVENNSKAKNYLSSRVTDVIEDLALLAECERQIQLYQPWASTFAEAGRNQLERYHDAYRAQLRKKNELLKALGRFKAWEDVDPSNGQFFYPVDRRRTKENTEAMQKAERNLDSFWRRLDTFLLGHGTETYINQPLAKLIKSRALTRTLDWVPDQVLPRRPPGSMASGGQDADEISLPISQLHLDSESSTRDNKDEVLPAKPKIKTRGTATASTVSTHDLSSASAENSEEVDTERTFAVDKRALKVFSTLFYQPSSSAQPGEIPWIDFLHAMISIGFAVEKLYGSVWHFTPTVGESSDSTDNLTRSIQFHEPHPVPKIPYRRARTIGRRLLRAYGWHGEMFRLADA
ncbi:hypothetical protein BGZ83_011357 [Gryganskiella cystojenkinii]|nr:hypothetical protein BGZ83_011357 [Gryganskiella cystojenkinii]